MLKCKLYEMQLDGITGDDIRGGICSIRKVGYLKQN